MAQILAREDIQVFAVSTENRPKVMTPEWLANHQNETLASRAVSDLGVPTYTLYLAELVRRAGGQVYFLREMPTMADTFRRIAAKIRAEYTLGFYPSAEAAGAGGPADRTGRHELRVADPGAKRCNCEPPRGLLRSGAAIILFHPGCCFRRITL